MEQSEPLQRISDKIEQLALSRQHARDEASKLKTDIERLYVINAELQKQVDDLLEKNKMLEMSQSLRPPAGETTAQARQRISELVKEIDECISLLNK